MLGRVLSHHCSNVASLQLAVASPPAASPVSADASGRSLKPSSSASAAIASRNSSAAASAKASFAEVAVQVGSGASGERCKWEQT